MSHLSLSPCTGSRLQLASSSRHWCLHIEQPQAQHSLTTTHLWQSTSPPEAWDLRVRDTSWCHHRDAQNHFPELFHSPFLAGGMNSPPRTLSPWQFSSDNWKLISSIFTWLLLLLLLHKKKQKTNKPHLCCLSLTSPCLASFALNNAWNVVLEALAVTVCLFIMYRLLYSSIVSRFG